MIENDKSQIGNINCGVPQHLLLGYLFFLLFINDLPNCCPTGKVRMFADDKNVFLYSDNIEDLINSSKIIMLQLNSWFDSNKLILNTSKSSSTIFKSVKKKILIFRIVLIFLIIKLKENLP